MPLGNPRTVRDPSQSGQPHGTDSLTVRWFRPRSQPLVLRTVQLRVTLADPDVDDGPSGTDVLSPDGTTLVPEIPAASATSVVSAAPPLAVRPLEDADWTFHN